MIVTGRSLVVLVALLLSACSALPGFESAETATTRFHARYDSAAFSQMYSEADTLLKQATSEAEYSRAMRAANSALGKMKGTRRTAWHIGLRNTGHFVAVTYDTRFERGTATEEFLWRVREKRGRLVAYGLNSSAFTPFIVGDSAAMGAGSY